jgi:hypothetical protein
MIEGGIFLSVSRIRCSYFRFIDRVERNIPSEEERTRLSEEQLDRFRELVDYHYNCLQSGDNKLRGFGWDWIVDNNFVPEPEQIVDILNSFAVNGMPPL